LIDSKVSQEAPLGTELWDITKEPSENTAEFKAA
jgi:hypothetical protein